MAPQPPPPCSLVAGPQYQTVQHSEVTARQPIYQVGVGRTGLDDRLDSEPRMVPGASKTAV